VACNRPAGETKSQDKLVEALSGASADAGSIPAASTSGFKPKMDRNNRYILALQATGRTVARVIEPDPE